MYILKNAITSIKRSKGRNILIGIIIIVIATSCAITLAIRESANKIITAYEEKNEIKATIAMDRRTLMEKLRSDNKTQEEMINAFNNIESVSVEEIEIDGKKAKVLVSKYDGKIIRVAPFDEISRKSGLTRDELFAKVVK